MPNQSGKRYVCAKCGAEMLVTKAGDGQLSCDGEPMTIRGATPSTKQGA
jgi:desulfoferrodoxin-like iron-binding protein